MALLAALILVCPIILWRSAYHTLPHSDHRLLCSCAILGGSDCINVSTSPFTKAHNNSCQYLQFHRHEWVPVPYPKQLLGIVTRSCLYINLRREVALGVSFSANRTDPTPTWKRAGDSRAPNTEYINGHVHDGFVVVFGAMPCYTGHVFPDRTCCTSASRSWTFFCPITSVGRRHSLIADRYISQS